MGAGVVWSRGRGGMKWRQEWYAVGAGVVWSGDRGGME